MQMGSYERFLWLLVLYLKVPKVGDPTWNYSHISVRRKHAILISYWRYLEQEEPLISNHLLTNGFPCSTIGLEWYWKYDFCSTNSSVPYNLQVL